MCSNVIAHKALRTLIRKGMAVVQEMCLRLLWLKAFFLQGEHAGIVRCWLLDHYLKVGFKVVMTWDASP